MGHRSPALSDFIAGTPTDTYIVGSALGVPTWEPQSFIVHANLTGLAADDHSQYLLLAGRVNNTATFKDTLTIGNGIQFITFQTSDPGNNNFTFGYFQANNAFDVRPDDVLRIGYNLAATALARADVTDVAASWTIESNYHPDAVTQTIEIYADIYKVDGSYTRPWAAYYNRATDKSIVVFDGDSFSFRDVTDATTWLSVSAQGFVFITSASTIAHFSNAVNSAATMLINGPTKGMRIGTTTSGSVIEGVDNTGTGSYQPMSFGGSQLFFTISNNVKGSVTTGGTWYIGATDPGGTVQFRVNGSLFASTNIGAGQSAPSARVHLAAGTATASTAPLKFASGVNLSTPEAGAMEYDGTSLYFTNASVQRQIVQRAYGSMYANEASIAVTITVANTYVQVGSGISDGGSSVEFTFQNARELKCNLAGTYKVVWSMSVNDSVNNHDVSGGVMLNGTTMQTNTISHAFVGTGANKNSVIASTGILTLALNDVVSLAVTDHTGAATVTVEHLNLTIMKVL